MTNENRLGKMLKQRRLMIPLTLGELTEKSGVSSSHIGRIERGERFPSASVLQKISKPLGFEEDDLMVHAGYLTRKGAKTDTEVVPDLAKLDPHVVRLLAQEPAEIQSAVIGILSILKFLGRAAARTELPEFHEYMKQKYPGVGEDVIKQIEELLSNIT